MAIKMLVMTCWMDADEECDLAEMAWVIGEINEWNYK